MTSPFRLLERYLSARRAEGLKPGTIALQDHTLRHFLAWLSGRGTRDLRGVTPADVAAYAITLAHYRYRRSKAENAPWKPLAPKTRAESLRFVASFFAWLTRARLLLADPAASCVPVFPRRSLPKSVLSEADVVKLLETPDTRTLLGLRDAAILALLYSSGLRRKELSALDLTDLDPASGTVFVRCGKNGKSRLAVVGDSAVKVLLAYIEKARPELSGKKRSAALFLGVHRGERLEPATISYIVLRTAEKAGFPHRVMAHALRHSVATHLLRAGADIRHVQAILGHEDITATEIYTHVAVRDLVEVLARSHPRFRQKPAELPPLEPGRKYRCPKPASRGP